MLIASVVVSDPHCCVALSQICDGLKLAGDILTPGFCFLMRFPIVTAKEAMAYA